MDELWGRIVAGVNDVLWVPNNRQTALLAWGVVGHLVADWFVQNHWMATTKGNWKSWGAWVHAWSHGIAAAIIFPWPVAVILAVVHMVIDTRKPLEAWGRLVGQSTAEQLGPANVPFLFLRDQAAHVLCVAIAAWWCGR